MHILQIHPGPQLVLLPVIIFYYDVWEDKSLFLRN